MGRESSLGLTDLVMKENSSTIILKVMDLTCGPICDDTKEHGKTIK